MSARYFVQSPDGFSISTNGKTFSTPYEATIALQNWIKSFEKQGYYSTIIEGERVRISLTELPDHCKILPDLS